jgi:hypothetical protein
MEDQRSEVDPQLTPGVRVRGCVSVCGPNTNGLYLPHEFSGTIEAVDGSRPQIGLLFYIRLDVPIARWFGDGWTHIHSARYNSPLSIEPPGPAQPAPHTAIAPSTACRMPSLGRAR